MNVEEWQKRITDNFSYDGYVGGNLSVIYDMEKLCGEQFVEKYHGQNVLTDSFQGFLVETITIALDYIKRNDWPKASENYGPILLYYVVLFRSFRAAETLLLKGYPLDGYALLRDIKDRTIFLAGIAHNITTLPRIIGNPEKKKERKKIKQERKNEEFKVLNRIIRKESGLADDDIALLEKWENLFHEEVHGSKLTFANELSSWVKGEAPLSIGPSPRELPITMYTNRASEIAWMIVRLLPYLQPEDKAFGKEWNDRQKILDDSFMYMQQGLAEKGKLIGEVFTRFIDKKFSFPEPFYYSEATGEK